MPYDLSETELRIILQELSNLKSSLTKTLHICLIQKFLTFKLEPLEPCHCVSLEAHIQPTSAPCFDQNSVQNDSVGINKTTVEPDHNFPDGSFLKIPHIQTGAA